MLPHSRIERNQLNKRDSIAACDLPACNLVRVAADVWRAVDDFSRSCAQHVASTCVDQLLICEVGALHGVHRVKFSAGLWGTRAHLSSYFLVASRRITKSLQTISGPVDVCLCSHGVQTWVSSKRLIFVCVVLARCCVWLNCGYDTCVRAKTVSCPYLIKIRQRE